MEDTNQSAILSSPFVPPSLLPISRYREELLYVIEISSVTVVVGATGSGKTTQLPQFLERAGWCKNGKLVAVTQPRRVAVTSVALRVADEMRCEVGAEVGYSIRFEDVTSARTRIKFLTDGLLLREALVDPLLSRYSVIMIDEAHERSLSSDLLLGLLKKIKKRRQDLKIIISSATLQAREFVHFFGGNWESKDDDNKVSVFPLGGRNYPVDIQYLVEPDEDYMERAIQTVLEIHSKEPTGDILVFLTGREEVEHTVQQIADRTQSMNRNLSKILALPLFAGLSTDEQMYVFEAAPENTRKVIVATNIAEASITIDGIAFVVDCGFVKLRTFSPNTGIESLTVTPISKASALQRAGRAGRTKPGKCYRLYTEQAYDSLSLSTVPEIQRTNFAPTILQLKALGIDNIARFDFLTPPPAELVVRGLELLYSLGAIDSYAKLTSPSGIRMAEIGIEPMTAKYLLQALSFDCVDEMLSIAAMINVQGSVWFQHDGEGKAFDSARRKFAAEEGDHLTLLNVYQAFFAHGRKSTKWCQQNRLNYKSMTRAVSIRNQLRRYLERFGINVDAAEAQRRKATQETNVSERIRRCLTSGLFAHAARMQPDGTYRTASGAAVLHAHPSSLMFNRKADWVIFQEAMDTGSKVFMKDVTKIEKSWLLEYASEYYQFRT